MKRYIKFILVLLSLFLSISMLSCASKEPMSEKSTQKEESMSEKSTRKQVSKSIQLTSERLWNGNPCWSPDGKKIAFVSNRGGYFDIWVIQNLSSFKDVEAWVEEADLDGDGHDDVICLDCGEDEFTFTLFVNELLIAGEGDNLCGYFEIIDINSGDNLKEIAIPEEGSSDDYAIQFFYYDGEKIVPMGKVEGAFAREPSWGWKLMVPE